MNSIEATAVIAGVATTDNVGVVYVRSARRPPLILKRRMQRAQIVWRALSIMSARVETGR